MYKPHHGGRAVRLDVQAPEVTFRAGGQERKLFRVGGAASVKGKDLTLTLVHTHVKEPAEIAVRLRGGAADSVRQTVLTHERLNAHNTFEEPGVVMPKAASVEGHGPEVRCTLPPASVSRLDVRLA
jgi:alpha-N-arabinofuranosidase